MLKKLLNDFSEYGVKVDKDTVTLDLDLVSKLVPYFYFKLQNINTVNGTLELEAQDVIYSERKPVASIEKETEQ